MPLPRAFLSHETEDWIAILDRGENEGRPADDCGPLTENSANAPAASSTDRDTKGQGCPFSYGQPIKLPKRIILLKKLRPFCLA